MDDAKFFKIRNLFLITFALLASAVMWSNVIGLAGAMSVVVHLLLLANIVALVIFVRRTGAETLLTSPLPIVVVGLLVVGSIARFIYAISVGD